MLVLGNGRPFCPRNGELADGVCAPAAGSVYCNILAGVALET